MLGTLLGIFPKKGRLFASSTGLLKMYSSLHPAEVRKLIRNGKLKGKPTKQYCQGYKQANLAIIPRKYEEDFMKFTKHNSAALPLLYCSQPGQYTAHQLAEDCDVRTDVPLYLKLANGKEEILQNLTNEELSEFVTFYLGCSFSFNSILISNGIKLKADETRNASMYRTNISNFPCGVFAGNLIVSMRYIPQHQLSFVTSLTFPLDDVHGAPIHYGNPKQIGIEDISKPDYGDVTILKDDDDDDIMVPVFWCCGVTGVEAMKSLDLSYSHHPGCMFITDIQQKTSSSAASSPSHVIQYKHDMYGVISDEKLKVLNELAEICAQDIGNRGMKGLVVDGDFVKSCLALSYANNIAVTTGFPVNKTFPFGETDGLPGIIALCAILASLGKQVTVICDDYNYDLYTKIFSRCYDRDLIPSLINIECGSKISLISDHQTPRFDAMLSSERAGRSSDGRYYSMKGRDLTDRLTSRIDDVFMDGMKCDDVVTIGIGDGGNELGMGKVKQQVMKEIPDGEKIGSVTQTDLLLACGVSNWGCEALSFGISQLMTCPYHERHLRRGIGFTFDLQQIHKWTPSVERSRAILSVVEEFGILDGISPTNRMSVDGMLFENEHKTILQQMQKCCC